MQSFVYSAWPKVSSGQMVAAILMITTITIIIITTTTTTQVVYKSRGLITSFVINDTMLDINFIYLLLRKSLGF